MAAPGKGASESAGRCRGNRLEPRGTGLDDGARKKGGQATGPSPTDRGKPGCKRHLVVDAQGIPLAHVLTPANVTDSKAFELTLDAVPPIQGPLGRPRRRPEKLHADKAYDRRHCREYLLRYHIVARIARIGVESSERLGRHRWVIERTEAWFNRFRRLRVRDERLASIHEAFISLAASLILLSYLQRAF